ncbi:MAG: hypothetical protein ACOWW1_02145 [archaeon]
MVRFFAVTKLSKVVPHLTQFFSGPRVNHPDTCKPEFWVTFDSTINQNSPQRYPIYQFQGATNMENFSITNGNIEMIPEFPRA